MKTKLLFLFSLLLLLGCVSDAPNTPDDSSVLFTQLSGNDHGLNFSNDLKSSPDLNILEYLYYYNGGGVGIGDFDGDGLEDVFLTSNEGQDKLFKNLGNLQFEDISNSAGILREETWSSGVAIIDIDNDQDLDIYVTKVAPVSKEKTHNLLYINDGNANFTEKSKEIGLAFSGYGTQALFLDYDRDGDNDIYLINHSVHSVRSFGNTSQRNQIDSLSGDRFFQNISTQEEIKFIEITKSTGIYSSALGYGLSGCVTDINQDGWPDIYVCNDFHENDYLYINNTDGSFTESSNKWFSNTSKFSMGVDIADIDGDNELDIFTTDMLPWQKEVAMKSGGEDSEKVFEIRASLGYDPQYARNHLHLKSQDRFLELAHLTNTYATDWSWAVLCQDFDHNGLTDIFISNGIVNRPNDLDYMKFLNRQQRVLTDSISTEELSKVLEIMPSQKISNILFRQNEKLDFSTIENSKIGMPTFSNGAAYSDLDNDGDLDLITNNINSQASIYQNNSIENNFIAFLLRANESCLGSTIQIFAKNKSWKKVYNPIRAYQSTSSHKIHFPLPKNVAIDSVLVSWPNGSQQMIDGLAINAIHTISPKSGDEYVPSKKAFVAKENFKIHEIKSLHLDNEFADYDHDALIPEKLSREGPPIHAADFNGDGINDLYIGGGRFSAAKLLMGTKDNDYIEKETLDFRKDNKYEDVAVCSFDFDNDGDLDLYVSSGGNDVKELNELIQDRIYINQGDGELRRLPVSLPFTNGSSVASGDINGDGFPEIFIGARSIPYAYGLSPYSFLLSSRKGFGIDMIWKKRLGMITDSQITDINGDQKNDLIVCGDWMPIIVGINIDGILNFDNTQTNSLNPSKGLWNKLYLADINKDGIQDIFAGNAGLNLKWKASIKKPISMHILDMDKNGSTESFIFSDYFGQAKPFHALDKMTDQVPTLKKRYLKYEDFAKVNSIKDLSSDDVLETKEINTLSSGIFISTDSSYSFHVFPKQLQYTSIKDINFQNGQLIYIGNEDRWITELGSINGFSAGLIECEFMDSLIFKTHRYLDIDPNLKTRNLEKIDNNHLILSAYKSNPLIIEIN